MEQYRPPSSSGLGHHPFKVAARVRIPLGVRLVNYRPRPLSSPLSLARSTANPEGSRTARRSRQTQFCQENSRVSSSQQRPSDRIRDPSQQPGRRDPPSRRTAQVPRDPRSHALQPYQIRPALCQPPIPCLTEPARTLLHEEETVDYRVQNQPRSHCPTHEPLFERTPH